MAGNRQHISYARQRLTLFFSAILVCVALLGIAASTASALPERFFGMTAHEDTYRYGPEYGEPNWAAMQKAGVQRFRLQIKWQIINEAGGGGERGWTNEWAWQNTYDQYFERAAIHGIDILPYLYTRKGGNTEYYWPGEPAFKEWSEFVWTVVQRYGQAGSFWVKHSGIPQYPVKYWEVWNEPNLPMNCPVQSCNGKTYGEFLVATSKVIREAQYKIHSYTAQVIFGGLYMERWNQGLNIPNYMSAAALAPGIKAAYDGLSIHPYALGREGFAGEWLHTYPEKATGVWSNVDGAYNAQKNAQTNGEGTLGAKPLWITEVGWPVDEGSGSPYDPQHVDEGEQAGLLNETYNWTKSHFSEYNIKYVAWYFYQDINAPTWSYKSGLKNIDGDYRQSWYAYQGQTGSPKWPANYRYMLGTSNGSGFSWGSTSLAGMSQPIQMDLGDVNGDGKADIVAAENDPSSGKYRYMLGASTGSNFSWNFTKLTGMSFPIRMALGDVNGDKKADIVGVERDDTKANQEAGHEKYRYMLGASTGSNFEWNFTSLGGMDLPVKMAVGDVSGDGKADIVAVERELSGQYRYMLGASTGGNFSWNFTKLSGMGFPVKMAVGDVNGDKKADIVAVESEGGGKYRYMLGASTGNNFEWNFTNLTWMGFPTKMGLRDVNGDGKADIVAMESSGNEKYLYGLGISNGSTFTWNTVLSGMGHAQRMGLGDVNGDGKADIVGAESY